MHKWCYWFVDRFGHLNPRYRWSMLILFSHLGIGEEGNKASGW